LTAAGPTEPGVSDVPDVPDMPDEAPSVGETPSVGEALAANRAWWDAAVPVHLASDFYDVEGWLAQGRGPRAREAAVLGDVHGLDLVHLQCHFGKDTLAWARAGATVTGLDFSPAAVDAARELADRAGIADRADFVCAPVTSAVDALGGRTFDIVYVSLGALCWLPAIDAWAAQVAELLRPGGRLFLHEVHPLSMALADEDLTVVYPYFEQAAPYANTETGTYADATATEALPGDTTYGWNHGLGEIVGALLGRGLRLDLLDEHDWTSFARFPWLVETGEEEFVTPADRIRVPLSFTLVASRP
jgi:SAM-dependent methyltransferase